MTGIQHALSRVLFVICLGGLLAWNLFLAYKLATDLRLNDFGRFYYSAQAFLQGQDMYGSRPPEVAQKPEVGKQQFGNMNPPHFHLLLLPFTLFSSKSALALWGIVSVLCLVVSLRLSMWEIGFEFSSRHGWLGLLGMLGFVGTSTVFMTGQLSFLLLLPVTLAWVEARRGHWGRAGGYLGLTMSVKPFLLIFLPYLVLRRRIRAAVMAGIVGAGCFFVGMVVFGLEAHRAWVRELSAIHWVWANGNASLLGFLTRTLSASAVFSPIVVMPEFVKPLWCLSAGVVGVCSLRATMTDTASASSIDRDFAILLFAALLISPLGWTYYFWLPGGPLVACVHGWWGLGVSGNPREDISLLLWRKRLLLFALPGLVWPFVATSVFQPHGWATVSIGSIYFWTILCLWGSLIVDWRVAGGRWIPLWSQNQHRRDLLHA
jgi:hypothetical protein